MARYNGHKVTASFPDKHAFFPLDTAEDGDLHYVGELDKVLQYDEAYGCWKEVNDLLEDVNFMGEVEGLR